MWELLVNRLRAPSVSQMILREFDDFDIRVIHPGNAALVADDVGKWAQQLMA